MRRIKNYLVCGVGVNDADYVVRGVVNGERVSCPFYLLWVSLLKRCYAASQLKRHPAYEGCSVVPEWHRFSVFKSWMERQDWRGKYLDKDLLVRGNKIYGPDTCLFVTRVVNNALLDRKGARSHFPLGIATDKTKKFRAQISTNGRRAMFFGFNEPEAAHRKWQEEKAKYLREIAAQQKGRVKASLIARAERINADRRLGVITHAL